jgi:N-acetyl-gamma-glutamyl-phosphate reductase / acetylglutamate kinase
MLARGRAAPVVGTRSASFTGTDTFAVINELMRTIGSGEESHKEVEQFMKTFQGKQQLAVIKVGGEVIEDELDVFSSSISFLHRVGLFPIVVHGAGPQMNRELEARGVEPQYVGGMRVTDEATLAIARKIFLEVNLKLCASLEKHGTAARPVPSGVFAAEFKDEQLGYVGEISSVNELAVRAGIDMGAVPVVAPLGESGSGQLLNINADVAARLLAMELQPLKTVFISAKGGWLDDDTKAVVPTIDLRRDYEEMASRDYTGRQGTLLKLKEIKLLMDSLPKTSTVSITAASGLTQELLSSHGAGTVVRHGTRIVRHDVLGGELDTEALAGLLQDGAYGKQMFENFTQQGLLRPSYFSELRGGSLHSLYLADDYSGCAILTRCTAGSGVPYLCKFAVREEAQPTGLADALWEAVVADNPSVYWRSHGTSPINPWFFQRAEGTYHRGTKLQSETTDDSPPWTVFWHGTDLAGEQDTVRRLIDGALAAPRSFFSAEELPAGGAATAESAAAAPLGGGARESKRLKLGLIGARGYVGRELLRLVSDHPEIEVVCASSRQLAGSRVLDLASQPPGKGHIDGGISAASTLGGIDPELQFINLQPDKVGAYADVDVWVLAMPNGLAGQFVGPLSELRPSGQGGKAPILIDLGADYRFDDAWTYGLPEAKAGCRDALRSARLIANPGCYATAAQLGLLPLVPALAEGHRPHVFGVSGYSGAGTMPSPSNDRDNLRHNFLPYKLTDHIHEREVGHQLGTPVNFSPHVASFFQGINLTIAATLAQPASAEDVCARYSQFYESEPLVKVDSAMPNVRQIVGQHGVSIGGFTADEASNRVVVVSTIDNLLKGAATQALQNINLACGLDEFAGLTTE